MSKNFRKKRDAAWKKKQKQTGQMLSSSNFSLHYLSRCLQRGNGVLKPVYKNKFNKMIKSGEIIVHELGRKKKRIKIVFPETGETRIVDKKTMAGITFIKSGS